MYIAMTPVLRIGPYELYSVPTGRFGLDGGAMFGVVPKTLWERQTTPDAQNRIPLAARALLLKSPERRILIDVGLGDKFREKERAMYAVDQSTHTLLGSLRDLGFKAADITDVILTHLHFDHAGGSTERREGEVVPTFPQATYHLQESNWRHALKPTLRDQASYLSDDFLPLKDADQLKFYQTARGFDHDEELLPHIQALVCHGHTPGLQMIKISDQKNTVVYTADTVPTSAHLPIPWVMGYDLQPLVSIEEKASLHERIKKFSWKLFFEHDPKMGLAEIAFDEKGRPLVKAALSE